jgi:adenosylcobinamide kinase/adenosylcobinamide-phosphate guanylyltransferase
VARSLVFIGGGARSGKSRFALERAQTINGRRALIATAHASDAEMAERIRRHRAERADAFVTIENQELEVALRQSHDFDVVVIDCLTLFVSALVMQNEARSHSEVELAVEEHVARVLTEVRAHPGVVVVVSNEVGMGLVPTSPLGRVFRDAAGRANQAFAAQADELYLAALGAVLRLRPEPLQLAPTPYTPEPRA